MDRQQAVRIIHQLLDDYKSNDLNWNLGGIQEIYWNASITSIIEGEAKWEPNFETRTVGDEEQIMDVLEPTLDSLECHLLIYDDNGEKLLNDEIITEYDL